MRRWRSLYSVPRAFRASCTARISAIMPFVVSPVPRGGVLARPPRPTLGLRAPWHLADQRAATTPLPLCHAPCTMLLPYILRGACPDVCPPPHPPAWIPSARVWRWSRVRGVGPLAAATVE